VAVIDLNNIIRPKQVNSPNTLVSRVLPVKTSVYTDLHLDVVEAQNIGLGNSPAKSNDILVDNDIDAIKNSIRNIFNTRKGQKLLTPEFGSSLDQYLFEPVSDIIGRAIANMMLTNVSDYEPRIEVLKINVTPKPDQNQYYILFAYRFLELQKQNILTIVAQQGGQITIA
jgi:phage baseplate assembly protein W